MNIQKLSITVVTVGILFLSASLANAQVGNTAGNLRAQVNRPTLIGAGSSAKPTPNMGNVAPGTRLAGAATMLSNAADKMSTLSARLQVRITAAQTAGQNVTNLQTLLSDMQTKTTGAKIQATAMLTEVSGITPGASSKTAMKDALSKLLTGIRDLKAAGQDARQIIQGLIILGGNITKPATTSGVFKTSTNGY